jgi:hypothetical protein
MLRNVTAPVSLQFDASEYRVRGDQRLRSSEVVIGYRIHALDLLGRGASSTSH